MAVSSGECGVPFVCCWRQEDRRQEAGMAMFRDFLGIKRKAGDSSDCPLLSRVNLVCCVKKQLFKVVYCLRICAVN